MTRLDQAARVLALHRDRTDPGLDLALGAGTMPDDTLPAVEQKLVGELVRPEQPRSH